MTGTDRDSKKTEEIEQISSWQLRTVIHEMMSAFSGLRARAERIRRQLTSPAPNLSRIEEGVDDLLRTIEVLGLLLNNAVAPSLDPDGETSTDLDALVRRTIDSMASVAEHRGVHLEFAGRKDAPLVFGSPGLFRQVVYNLLQNAIKYSASDSRVDIQLEYDDTDALLRVTNIGVPIEESEKESIFGSGFRGDSLGRGPGSGIGLRFSRQIAEKWGGDLHIRVEDVPGEMARTSVELRLPAKKDAGVPRAGGSDAER